MRYPYQNYGTAMWPRGLPVAGSRAADTVALGGIFERPTLNLPVPGGPEILPSGMGDCGCGCRGAGTCKTGTVTTAMSGVMDTVAGLSPAAKIAAAIGAYYLYKKMKKRR